MQLQKQDNLHKELDNILSVISRMANNSLIIKGWAMTLMSAMLAFGKDFIISDSKGVYYLIAMLCILVPFWWLDAFYLKKEKIFRKIYEKVINDPEAEKRLRYDLNPGKIDSKEESISSIMRTDFMKWFYIPFILLICISIIIKLT